MSHNAAFEPPSNVPQIAYSSPPRPRTRATTTILAITASLTRLLLSTAAAPTQVETSSQRWGQVLPLCPAGTHLEPTRLVECLPCVSGVSFTSTVNRRTECLECLSCRGLILESPCNATHNTVCRCPPGHYLNIDGGCTILGSGNGTDSSVKSLLVAAAVNDNEKGQSCEKGSILTGFNTALVVLAVAGIIVIIIMTVKLNNVNWHCWKWTSSSQGRLSHSDAPELSEVAPLQQRDGMSSFSNGTQTDEPTNTQRIAPCCAEVLAKLDNETADHTSTKEKLDAMEKQLASLQQSPAVYTAALEKLGQELTSRFEQVRVAIGERQQENTTASNVANACLAETLGDSGSDSSRQVTDNSNRLTEVQRGDRCKADIQASQVIASVDNLKLKLERIVRQSYATNVARVILSELEAFLKNPSGYAQASTEAEDREAGSSHS